MEKSALFLKYMYGIVCFIVLQAFESFVCRCPKEVTPYIPKVNARN